MKIIFLGFINFCYHRAGNKNHKFLILRPIIYIRMLKKGPFGAPPSHRPTVRLVAANAIFEARVFPKRAGSRGRP